MQLRDRIRIAKKFVARDLCEQIIASVDPDKVFDMSLLNVQEGGTVENMGRHVDAEVRYTQSANLDAVDDEVNGTMQRIVADLVEPFYEFAIDYWEAPQLLIYPPGGHYLPHVDGEYVYYDTNPQGEWRRITDRDVSVIWYLNDDFTGGQLTFPDLDVTITPAPGMVVAFPSTHQFFHGALPVESGMRYAIVTWMAAVGTPRVLAQPPPMPHVRRGAYLAR
jgi:predicted 2-oxoglutarate/Fe(II)-dependent dioxygenase YbiX